jgi:hypothetical protein
VIESTVYGEVLYIDISGFDVATKEFEKFMSMTLHVPLVAVYDSPKKSVVVIPERVTLSVKPEPPIEAFQLPLAT